MEWFKDLYDDFRMRTGFGNITEEQTKKEVDFIIDVLGLADNSKVLDLFCGTGRHSIELSKRGFLVTGVEFNSDYLKIANERALNVLTKPKFIQGDVRTTDFGNSYDAVIIMYQSFGYFEDQEDKNILKRIYFCLKAKGRFLLEILNRDYILKHFSEVTEKQINGIKVIEKRKYDILKSRINSTITRYEEGKLIAKKMSWRLYSPHEIKNILEGIGFKFIVAYSNLNKDSVNLNTRLMRLIFEK